MPIQLACNHSAPLLRFLRQGTVDVDWIKISRYDTVEEDLSVARALRPCLIHVLGSAGRRPELWEGYDWATLQRWLTVAGSPHIALHLETRTEDWDGPVQVRCQDRAQTRAMLARLVAAVRRAQAKVSVPVLIENIPYHVVRGALRVVAQPEAVWQVMEETGADLLLDTSHLRCTAHNLGVDVYAYARALPLDRVREIHLSGPRLHGDILIDRHHALEAEDYALLEWLLARTRPAIVTLEYGGTGEQFETPERNDPQALEVQLQEIRRLL